VAVDPLEPVPEGLLANIPYALEASRVLYPADTVDLSCLGSEFRRVVQTGGIPGGE